jgi:hypothetical protein
MNSPEKNDPLDSALGGWQVRPPRDPGFRGRVWARIEAAKAPVTWPRYVRTHPVAMAGGLAAALVVGAISGREQAQARAAAASSQLAANYVQAMDARLMKMP